MRISIGGHESRSTLGRLLRMKWPELSCRARQEAFKWMERLQCAMPFHRARPRRLSFEPISHGDSEGLDRFISNAKEYFFEGTFDDRVPAALAIGTAHHCKEI